MRLPCPPNQFFKDTARSILTSNASAGRYSAVYIHAKKGAEAYQVPPSPIPPALLLPPFLVKGFLGRVLAFMHGNPDLTR
jgi:hypothetical protein